MDLDTVIANLDQLVSEEPEPIEELPFEQYTVLTPDERAAYLTAIEYRTLHQVLRLAALLGEAKGYERAMAHRARLDALDAEAEAKTADLERLLAEVRATLYQRVVLRDGEPIDRIRAIVRHLRDDFAGAWPTVDHVETFLGNAMVEEDASADVRVYSEARVLIGHLVETGDLELRVSLPYSEDDAEVDAALEEEDDE